MPLTRRCTTAIASWQGSSVADRLFALFDEYASAYARGERPEAREYLARAGEEGNELARLIDGFLQAAPVPELEPEVVDLFEGWLAGDSSLLRLRVARGMTRDRAVEELIDRLDLDRKKWAKVKRYYHQLEVGLLDLDRVDRRVFAALADALHARASDLSSWRPHPVEMRAAYRRTREQVAFDLMAPASPASRADEDYDEIDGLFLGRR
jgi:hypothetical protein